MNKDPRADECSWTRSFLPTAGDFFSTRRRSTTALIIVTVGDSRLYTRNLVDEFRYSASRHLTRLAAAAVTENPDGEQRFESAES